MKETKLTERIQQLVEELSGMALDDGRFDEVMQELKETKEELNAERSRLEDLNAARYLLQRHGYAFRIWGPEDVERRVVALQNQWITPNPFEVAKIVRHVVEGDDWQTMAEETPEDDANLYAIIEGTRGDHPEWFGPLR